MDHKRITINPEIHFGKPCIAGTRIPIEAILELVRADIPYETIIEDYYPDLDLDSIEVVLCFEFECHQLTKGGRLLKSRRRLK